MKQFASFAWDGFKGSIELLKFIDGVTDDLIESICALVGTDTVFIKGGIITIDSGDTTITDGIIYKDGKLYRFTGGTYAGALPAALNVIFKEQTASGFPKPYFVGDPTPKDIYLERTATIDTPVFGDVSLVLDTIGSIHSLQYLKGKADLVDGKADKNGYDDITPSVSVAASFISLAGEVRLYHDGTVNIRAFLSYSGTIPTATNIITGLPDSWSFESPELALVTNGTASAVVNIMKKDGVLKTIDPLSPTYTGIAINLTYKKE